MGQFKEPLDLLVIGGGINGVGIANDAAGRGLSVGLYEQGDLACATSSASSKLIHGGLRYLEQLDFRLVRESLAERQVLLKKAPHIARPMRFCLPHRPSLRPAWLIRLGLFIYDHLGGTGHLPGCQSVDLAGDPWLRPGFKRGFEYSDGWVDDARLVVLNAIQLRQFGGDVRPYTRVLAAWRKQGYWYVRWQNQFSGQQGETCARALVNAAGPWVSQLLPAIAGSKPGRKLWLVKGSHIVVPAIGHPDKAYILQAADRRIVFVLPYFKRFSLIGTTDVPFCGDPTGAVCSKEEEDYLCGVANQYMKRSITPADIIWRYAGVRALCQEAAGSPQAMSRDYAIEIEDDQGRAPLVSVFGGKLTTYRKLAEAVMARLSGYFPGSGGSWTADHVLPGGAGVLSSETYARQLQQDYPWLDASQALRYSASYGSLAHHFLAGAASFGDLGEHFGAGLTAEEVAYLMAQEWAMTPEDVLWRRTKMGLFLQPSQQQRLRAWMAQAGPV